MRRLIRLFWEINKLDCELDCYTFYLCAKPIKFSLYRSSPIDILKFRLNLLNFLIFYFYVQNDNFCPENLQNLKTQK